MYYGGFTAGDIIVQMMGDFADPGSAPPRTERRCARSSTTRLLAETFAQAYSGQQWIDKERERLTKAIDSLAGDDNGKGVDS
jgi:hypothetical protein